MKASAAKEKTRLLGRARLAYRATGASRSYLQTRVRASRLYEAAFILAIAELTRRLHQAYEQAYDQQAADRLLPQNPRPLTPNENKTVDSIVAKTLRLLDSNGPCRDYIGGGSSRNAYTELAQIWANKRISVDNSLADYSPTNLDFGGTPNITAIWPPAMTLNPKFFNKDVAGVAPLMHVDTEIAQMVGILHETRHATRRNPNDHPNGEFDGPEGEDAWTKTILDKCFGIKWDPPKR